MGALLGLLFACACAGQAESAPGSTHRIVAEESIIGFVTFKAGFASALMDNNLVYPAHFTTRFVHGETPEAVQFSMKIASNSLVVNNFPIQQHWFPRLRDLRILDTPYRQTSESRKNKIRKTILAPHMLDATGHPYIEAKTTQLRKDPRPGNDSAYLVGLEITIRGTSTTVEWPATIVYSGDRIDIETHGVLKFTTFGIDPFSTAFGALRYRDDFQVYARLIAIPIAPASASAPQS